MTIFYVTQQNTDFFFCLPTSILSGSKMGRVMHLMMHAKIGVHVRLGSVGIRLTALLIIHQSYTPLCHQLAPAHMAAAVDVRKLKHAHIEHTHTNRLSMAWIYGWSVRVSACIVNYLLKWCMMTVVCLSCGRCMESVKALICLWPHAAHRLRASLAVYMCVCMCLWQANKGQQAREEGGGELNVLLQTYPSTNMHYVYGLLRSQH